MAAPTSRRLALAWVALVTVALACATAVVARAPAFKSSTYKGTLAAPKNSITISLKLRGRSLSRVSLSDIPFYCPGGGAARPFTFPRTRISALGKFTLKGEHVLTVGPFKGQIGERLTLTGQFRRHGHVSGTLKVVYSRAPKCNGSSRFSATG